VSKTPWSGRVVLRYFLFQLPTWVLFLLLLILIRQRIDFPGWVIPVLFMLWVIKDAFLFPYVSVAYDSRGEHCDPLIGSEGIVVRALSPHGYIQIRGELWRAEVEGEGPIPEGERVRVEAMKGLRLRVKPAAQREI